MKQGELIIMPTDTVYGLCAKLHDQEALQKIYHLKGREQTKQIPILLPSIESAKDIAVISAEAKTIMQSFWPGALTIVLKTTDAFKAMTGEETIALRIPNHPLALKLLEANGPLRATSVNKSGQAPLSDIHEIRATFGHDINQIYEQTEKASQISSTVIDLTSDLKILRQGTITEKDLKDILMQKGLKK